MSDDRKEGASAPSDEPKGNQDGGGEAASPFPPFVRNVVSTPVPEQPDQPRPFLWPGIQSITAISDLSLQAVIVPSNKFAEGKLIEAVTVTWFDIIDHLKHDPSVAHQILDAERGMMGMISTRRESSKFVL
jgi:hypothetical protein